MYRDDVEALAARHAALEAEVAERTRARDEVARLLAEARHREEAERWMADLASGGPARRLRRRILIAAVSVLALVGAAVAYRLTRPPRDHTAEAIAQFTIFVEQTCSCPDVACARQVERSMLQWVQSLPKEGRDSPPNLSKAQQEHVLDLSRKMAACMAKLNGAPE